MPTSSVPMPCHPLLPWRLLIKSIMPGTLSHNCSLSVRIWSTALLPGLKPWFMYSNETKNHDGGAARGDAGGCAECDGEEAALIGARCGLRLLLAAIVNAGITTGVILGPGILKSERLR